jgi:hypothetical protein
MALKRCGSECSTAHQDADSGRAMPLESLAFCAFAVGWFGMFHGHHVARDSERVQEEDSGKGEDRDELYAAYGNPLNSARSVELAAWICTEHVWPPQPHVAMLTLETVALCEMPLRAKPRGEARTLQDALRRSLLVG